MKLNEARVDTFGSWHDLSLPVQGNGLSVFYGPNAAGKTTLMRFLRGMLYGLPVDEDRAHANEPIGGSLGLLHRGQELRIARSRGKSPDEQVSVTGWDRVVPIQEGLDELLGGVTADIFANVFAIGLPELQELATLDAEAVADLIYGASLAPQGRKLLTAVKQADLRRRQLFDSETRSGQLMELVRIDREFAREIDARKEQRGRHESQCDCERQLHEDIAEMKTRKAGMHSQLRGHRFLKHVYGPWKQVREYRELLADVPDADRFPENGLERLAELDTKFNVATEHRRTLRESTLAFKTAINALTLDKDVRQQAVNIRALVADRERIADLISKSQQCHAELARLSSNRDECLAAIGNGWTSERLAAVDDSAERQHELLDAARKFQSAVVRRGRFQRIYDRLSKAHRKQRSRDERREASSPEDALTAAGATLAASEEQRRLKRRAAELTSRIAAIQNKSSLVATAPVMPKWFYGVLVFFAVAGGLVCLAGAISGLTGNMWAGGILSLLGLSGLGIAWGLQTDDTRTAGDAIDPSQAERQDSNEQLREVEEALAVFEETTDVAGTPTEWAGHVARKIGDAEYTLRTERLQKSRRRRLVTLRGRIPRIQQAVTESRGKWCEALQSAGLPDDLKVADAFNLWSKVLAASEIERDRETARVVAESHRLELEVYRQRINTVSCELGGASIGHSDWLTKLDEWRDRLDTAKAIHAERRLLLKQVREGQRQFVRLAKRSNALIQDRNWLLLQGGAANREEFERRAAALEQKAELLQLLELADEELTSAAATEPELAIAEEDLIAFNSAGNSECIQMLELEIGEIETDLQAAHEALGGIKQSIDELANDRRLTTLNYERARVREKLKQTTEELLGVQFAAGALEKVRVNYERDNQPEVLAAAAGYFERLTGGQYRNVWTPLGRRLLCVDDEQQKTRTVEQLSGGTREQLFLAIRLAAIDGFYERGVELPLILDDILVNFDQHRTESAISVLTDFADHGRQILFFTCHQHLAKLFANGGAHVANLAELAAPHEERLAG